MLKTLEFKKGDYVEVGIGESIHDNNGKSIYFVMDKEGYDEFDLMDIFEEHGNVLYVKKVEDEASIRFAEGNKFSEYLEEEECDEYSGETVRVKIELEVELPKEFSESKVDTALADAIYKVGGQVIDSKEFKIIEE